MPEKGWGSAFLQKQVDYLLKHDVEGLMTNHYCEDAEMITFEFLCQGREAIGRYLGVDEPAKAGQILGMTMNHYFESDDTIIFTCTIDSEKLGVFVARDALVFKEGKIWKHIALTIPPESDLKIFEAVAQGKK